MHLRSARDVFLKYIDARLMLTFGFSLVSIACFMNAHLSSAWSGANFGLTQAILALGLAFAFNSMVGAIILEVLNSGALKRPIDVLTFAGYFQTVRLFGGEAGAAFMQHFIAVREQFHSNILGLGVQLGHCRYRSAPTWSDAGMQSQVLGWAGRSRQSRGDSRPAGQTTSLHPGDYRQLPPGRLVGGVLPDRHRLHGAGSHPYRQVVTA